MEDRTPVAQQHDGEPFEIDDEVRVHDAVDAEHLARHPAGTGVQEVPVGRATLRYPRQPSRRTPPGAARDLRHRPADCAVAIELAECQVGHGRSSSSFVAMTVIGTA
jgi:hypothetical protein